MHPITYYLNLMSQKLMILHKKHYFYFPEIIQYKTPGYFTQMIEFDRNIQKKDFYTVLLS